MIVIIQVGILLRATYQQVLQYSVCIISYATHCYIEKCEGARSVLDIFKDMSCLRRYWHVYSLYTTQELLIYYYNVTVCAVDNSVS